MTKKAETSRERHRFLSLTASDFPTDNVCLLVIDILSIRLLCLSSEE